MYCINHLIFGYKISDNNYYGVNYFITILGFSIYKSYYLSEQKTTNVNVSIVRSTAILCQCYYT
jgi:hypothetical protein